MGWFDKKSWQLRRKIRDLQSELAVAERDGKYVVEQGLFFAELREMADATIMVLGTAEHLDSEEDTVIRNFFERNGFTVEILKLDKTQKTLAAVEIIPPEELTRRVARSLKEMDFRLIDDSDQERPSNPDKKTLTLSSLLRAISALFAAHVNQLIISGPLKLNMEGNRLLHWMPLIRETTMKKVSDQVVDLCREPFVDAYNHYYGQFGKMTSPDALERFKVEEEESENDDLTSDIPDAANIEASGSSTTEDGGSWSSELRSRAADLSFEGADADTQTPDTSDRKLEAAAALAEMYKSLIGASPHRRVRNAEVLLSIMRHFFEARSICILTKRQSDSSFTLQSNSGDTTCMETTDDGAVVCDVATLEKAVAEKSPVFLSPHGNGNSKTYAVAMPIALDDPNETVIYLLEPANFPAASSADSNHLLKFLQVFREFPDLLIGSVDKK